MMAPMRIDGPLAIVPWVIVFGVGFAVGYALMSAMVDEPAVGEPQAVGDPARTVDAPAAADPSTAEPAPRADLIAAEAPVPPEAPPPPVAMPPSAAPDAPDAPGHAGAAVAADPDEELPWWDQCRAQECKVDFGGITGGLSIRRAALEHGATVSWERDFASRPRQEVLPTIDGVDVKLRAVGLDASGKPVAAEISYKKPGGATIEGVISLDLGEPGKQVVFRP